MISIFIFRRDLRIQDNLGLLHLLKNEQNVVPIFIFTPEQITSKNKFKSNNAIQFMIESLEELQKELRNRGSNLLFYQGDNIAILNKIHSSFPVKKIVFNQDYTPYAKKRDESIQNWCIKKDIVCEMIEDYLLAPIGTIMKPDNTPYTIFTPFKNTGYKKQIQKSTKSLPVKSLANETLLRSIIKGTQPKGIPSYSINSNLLVRGGRKLGLVKLNQIKKHKKYNDTRNQPFIPTTELSAYIKFGTISVREVYWKMREELGMQNQLLSQLFWREFYYYIVYYFPKVLHGQPFKVKNKEVSWRTSKKDLQLWKDGMTGYPIVDAGMRQLNTSGYMHNRLRLITSNFLNRMLGLDWREGELYYAQQLTDYDPSVNNGNWQWTASVGVDPKPYFQRIYNPWLQSERVDKDTNYIKKWIPELKDVLPEHLHHWDIHYKDYPGISYPPPCVDYKYARERSIKMFQATK